MDAVAHFEQSHQGLTPGGEWLDGVRGSGLGALSTGGFPGRKNEDWKYTNPGRILGKAWGLPAGSLDVLPAGALCGAHTLVLVDGQVDLAKSTLLSRDGVRLQALGPQDSVGTVLGEPQGFDALTDAFLGGGAAVVVDSGVVVDEPLHIVHVALGGGTHAASRVVIRLGRSASATVVEHWVGLADSLTTAVSEVTLEANASLTHVRVQDGDDSAHHVGTVVVHQEADSRFGSHAFTLGGAVGRLDLRSTLAGSGAEARLWGLYLGAGTGHCDHHTSVVHAMPHTTSFEHYKGVLADKARGVFTGKIVVEKDAQKISSSQSNDNLLLSDHAIANTRPQLEIYADDVQCAHGATIGRLDDEASFYLRQRGLSADEARGLLTYAFANEVLAALPAGAVRDALEGRVAAWLDAR